MMHPLFPERPSLFREARLVHFAPVVGPEQQNQPPEGEAPLDTKIMLQNTEAIDAAKKVRIKTADDALTSIDNNTQTSLKNIATLEFNELKGDKTEQADLEKAAQTVQDRFSHADIHATFVVNADKSVTWDFQPLEAKDSDFDVSIPAELRQKMKDVINSASPGTELVFKEFMKGATMESLDALVKLQDSEASRKGITYALNSMDWSGTKESVDASIAAVPDAQQRAAITAFREAFGDAKIAQLQSSVKRVGAEKPEENMLANPRQQEALDKRLSVNISKMKDYEVMRIQGQIMQNFGVNVNVEGEGDSRKLVAEPYNPESAKLIKFMGMVTIVMSWVAQLREMKDRMEGKSTEKAKAKPGEVPVVPGGNPETPAPVENPEVGAKKKGADILTAAAATKAGDAYTLDLAQFGDATFSFDAGVWKIAQGGDPIVEVKENQFSAPVPATAEQTAEIDKLNAVCKDLAKVNDETKAGKTEVKNADTKKTLESFNNGNTSFEAVAVNETTLRIDIKDAASCTPTILKKKCDAVGLTGAVREGESVVIENTPKNIAALNKLNDAVRKDPETLQQLQLLSFAEAIDIADPGYGLAAKVEGVPSGSQMANQIIAYLEREHADPNATNFMVLSSFGQTKDHLFLNDGWVDDTNLVWGFKSMLGKSPQLTQQALSAITEDRTVVTISAMTESIAKTQYVLFQKELVRSMNAVAKHFKA